MSGENVELEEKRVVSDDEVERIPWREYIRMQFRKVLGFILMLVLLFVIITISRGIADPDEINPTNVISTSNGTDLVLMFLSSILFLAVLVAFTKIVLVDNKIEFGIESWQSPKAVITLILTTSFISLVFILLDVSLANIFMMTLPTWTVWTLPSFIPSLGGVIPAGTDRISYSQIRTFYFTGFLVLLFVFPLTMFMWILSRMGRKFFKKRRENWKKLPIGKFLQLFVLLPIIAGISMVIYGSIGVQIQFLGILFILVAVVAGFVWLIVVLLLLVGFIRVTLFLTYSNFLLVIPIVFLFYLVPGILWSVWDILVIVSTDSISNTIYDIRPGVVDIDPGNVNIENLSSVQLMQFFLQTVVLNLGNFIRVIQLDFVIIVGISAVVLGFAEGYSILAILRSIARGVSIAKTGRVARRSAPKMVVISTRLIYLLTWLSLLWDKLLVIADNVLSLFSIRLPVLDFPKVFGFIIDLTAALGSLSDYLLVLTILAVPFYFIVTSAFKFLSVGLVLERFDEDEQAYYLLISSAFILIVSNILVDISRLSEFLGPQKQFLPIAAAATENLLPFASRILDLIESVAFYGGVIVSIIVGSQSIIARKKNQKDPKPQLKKQELVSDPDILLNEESQLENTSSDVDDNSVDSDNSN